MTREQFSKAWIWFIGIAQDTATLVIVAAMVALLMFAAAGQP